MLKSKIFKAGFIAAFIVITALAIMGQGQGPFFTNPIFRGNTSGNRFIMTWKIADVTADTWVLGDTTAAGMYVPEQPLEITDVKLFGDPDSGDSLRVLVYAANGGQANETVVTTSYLLGTTWARVTDSSVSSTYGIVTATEGMGILIDFQAGTPNSVTLTIEGKYRQGDYLE